MNREEFRVIFRQADEATQKRMSEVKSCWTILEEELFRLLEKYEVRRD